MTAATAPWQEVPQPAAQVEGAPHAARRRQIRRPHHRTDPEHELPAQLQPVHLHRNYRSIYRNYRSTQGTTGQYTGTTGQSMTVGISVAQMDQAAIDVSAANSGKPSSDRCLSSQQRRLTDDSKRRWVSESFPRCTTIFTSLQHNHQAYLNCEIDIQQWKQTEGAL